MNNPVLHKRVTVQRVNMRDKGKLREGVVIRQVTSPSVDSVDSITVLFDSGHETTYYYLHDYWTPKSTKRGEYKIEAKMSE